MIADRALLDLVENILPTETDGIGYGRAHELVGLWSPFYIRNVLRFLDSKGRAISVLGVNAQGKPVRLYRRAPAAAFVTGVNHENQNA